MAQFAIRTDEEIAETKQNVQPKNTLNADKKSETVFKEFLKANNMTEDFFDFDEETLSKWLSKLWFGARQKQTKDEVKKGEPGKRYQANSLRSMRYAINRLLAKSDRSKNFDIIASEKFISCQRANLKMQ